MLPALEDMVARGRESHRLLHFARVRSQMLALALQLGMHWHAGKEAARLSMATLKPTMVDLMLVVCVASRFAE